MCIHTNSASSSYLIMPNDRDINQANQPTDPAEDLSDLPELIDCDPNVEPHTAPPQPHVLNIIPPLPYQCHI